MTHWRKLGLRVEAPGEELMRTHAMLPTPWLMQDRIRVFFSACDADMRGRIFYADLDRRPPYSVLHIETQPVLNLGKAGEFDSDGVNPSCLVPREEGGLDLYYIGWRRISAETPYTLIAGLASSDDDGLTFRKHGGPLLQAGGDERFFRTAPFVWRDGESWAMLYIGGGEFFNGPGDKRLPIYSLRLARSDDRASWTMPSRELLRPDLAAGEIGFGRPVLWRDRRQQPTLMLSVRTASGYRLVDCSWAAALEGRFDFADSVTPGPEAWDADMTCFGTPIVCDDAELLFYNGNRFGWSGFGLAVRPLP